MSGEAASLTGAEHFAEAERLIYLVSQSTPNGQITYFEAGDDGDTAVTLAAAQVHATLALASAASEITAERRANKTKPEPPSYCSNCGTTPRPKCPLCHGGTS